MMDTKADVLECVECGTRFREQEVESAKACPKCHTTRAPMWVREEVTLRLNWYWLRCLANWAMRHVDDHTPKDDPARKALSRILGQLNAVRPKGATALTIRAEIAELTKAHPELDIYQLGADTVKIVQASKKPTVH